MHNDIQKLIKDLTARMQKAEQQHKQFRSSLPSGESKYDGEATAFCICIDELEKILHRHQLSNDVQPQLHKRNVGRSLPADCKDHQRGKDDECKYPVGSCELCRQ